MITKDKTAVIPDLFIFGIDEHFYGMFIVIRNDTFEETVILLLEETSKN